MTRANSSIRTLVLPNKGHPYGDCLQEGLRQCGVDTLAIDADWGFDLRKHVSRICALAPDILHLQWPESLYQIRKEERSENVAQDIADALSAFKQAGIRLVWTLHNLKPHITNDPNFQNKVYAHYAANASGVIHHSACGMKQALETYTFSASERHVVQRHGYFAPDSVSSLSQPEARARLGLEAHARIYLFCGAFRLDKNMDVMLNAIGSDQPGEILIMVGQDMDAAAGLYPGLRLQYPNVRWVGRLTFEELGVYVRAADALITAHGEKHLTSAGPHLSQTYLKPQICLRTPYHEEVLGKSAFYFDAGESIAANLRACLSNIDAERLRQIPAEIEAGRSDYRWENIARRTKTFYEELLHAR